MKIDDRYITDARERMRKKAQNEATCFALNDMLKDAQEEVRRLREENERLRKELAKLREQAPAGWVDADGDFYHGRNYPNVFPTAVPVYAAPVPAPAVPELDPMTRLIVSDPKQLKPKKQEPAVPYGIDEEAANRIALAVYDCKHGINQEPLLYAINRILATEAHPLSAEGQRSLLQSAEGSNAAADRLLEGGE